MMKRVMRSFVLFVAVFLGASHVGADDSRQGACRKVASDVRNAKTALETYFAGHYQFPEEFRLTSFEPTAGVVLIYETRSVKGPADEYLLWAYDESCDTIYATTSRSTEVREFTSSKPSPPPPPREAEPPQSSFALLLKALLGALILLVLVLILRIRSLTRLLRDGKSENNQASPEE